MKFFARTRYGPEHWIPESTVLITGIPRSGTSLASTLISGMPNAYCFNEIFNDVEHLKPNLCRARAKILRGRAVPNKYGSSGRPTTDTLRDTSLIAWKRVDPALSGEFLLGSNSNWSYLTHADRLAGMGCHLLAMFRAPTETLGSWLSESVRNSGIPETKVLPGEVHARWSDVRFETDDLVSRSAELWAHYAQLLLAHAERGRLHLLAYESLSEDRVELEFLPDMWGSHNIGGQRIRAGLPGDCIVDLADIERVVTDLDLRSLHRRLVATSLNP